MKKRQLVKRTLLLLLFVVTCAVPILSGTGGVAFQPKQVTADAAGTYEKTALDFAAATAFEDARSMAKMDESDDPLYTTFYDNLKALTDGNHWGNVGLFIGPRGVSKNVDNISTLFSSVTVDEKQMQTYDSETGDAFSKYKAFGTAMQKLNAQSMKKKGASSSLEEGLNEVSAAAAKLTNLGTNLIKDYNPAPLVLAMVDNSELSQNPDNKLVAVVNGNENLREMFSFLGSNTGFGIPWSYFLTCLAAFLLLVTSVLMTLFNGRAAGENIRKMIVKIVIGCVAVPLIAKGLNWGIDFLGDAADIQANAPNDQYVSQNLNLSDWYATGFSIPSGVSIHIDEKGRFQLSPENVKAINEHTYQIVTGKTPTPTAMKNRMEEAHVQLNQALNSVSFSEPIRKSDNEPWKTATFYRVLDQFGKNETWSDVEKGDPSTVGYLFANGLIMAKDGDGWNVEGTGETYGISPIAATNLMRTTFSSSSMVGNLNGYMGGVAFDVDTGAAMGDAHMNAIIRFLATFSLVMAAMKGLFSIFAAGFGGILGGSAKGALGSSPGLGQAVGGVIALVGGVFGIGVIMTMSFTLLDQVYGIVCDLFSTVQGGTNLLEPLAEAVPDIPIIGPLFARALKDVGSFLITLFCAITLPKFGGIPVTLFCQYLSELPHVMAERAQQIENKFTGDFRAGGGRMGGGAMGSAGSLFNQAANSGKDQMKALGKGASMVGGALLGFGAAKAGSALNNALDKKEGKDGETSMAEATDDETLANEEEAMASAEGDDLNAGMEQSEDMDAMADAADESAEAGADSDAMMGTVAPDPMSDGKEGDSTLAETYTEGSDVDTDTLSEEDQMTDLEEEDHNDSDVQTSELDTSEQSMATDQWEQSEQLGADIQNEQSSMSEQSDQSEHLGADVQSEQSSMSEQSDQSEHLGADVQSEQSSMSEQNQSQTQMGAENQSMNESATNESIQSLQRGGEVQQNHTQMGAETRSMNQSTAKESTQSLQQGGEVQQNHTQMGAETRSMQQSNAKESTQSLQQGGEVRQSTDQKQDSVAFGADTHSMEQASADFRQTEQGFASVQQDTQFQSERMDTSNTMSQNSNGPQSVSESSKTETPAGGVIMGGVTMGGTTFGGTTTFERGADGTPSREPATGRDTRMGETHGMGVDRRNDTRNAMGVGAPTNSRSMGAQTPAGSRSMDGARPSASPERIPVSGRSNPTSNLSKAQQQKQQSWRRTVRSVANGLEAAGAGKSNRQRVSEITAGMMHMAGGYTGMQNVTGQRVDAVRKEGQRQRDIKDNLGPQYTRRQEQRRATRQKQQQATRQTPNTATRRPMYNQAMLDQYEQRQYEDQRREEHQRRMDQMRRDDARRPKKE